MTSAAALTPAAGDILLRRADSTSERYVLSTPGGTPQLIWATFEMAATAAEQFARARHVDVWVTNDGSAFTRISSYPQRRPR
jgi:hypothetical protein